MDLPVTFPSDAANVPDEKGTSGGEDRISFTTTLEGVVLSWPVKAMDIAPEHVLGQPLCSIIPFSWEGKTWSDFLAFFVGQERWDGLVYVLGEEEEVMYQGEVVRIYGPSPGEEKLMVSVLPPEAAGSRSLMANPSWWRFLNMHHEPICISVDMAFVYGNDAFRKIMGAEKLADIIGRPIFDFLDDDQEDRFKVRNRKIVRGEGTDPIEHYVNCLDGSRRFIRSYSVPQDFQGRRASLAVLQDLTDHKETEQALQHSEQKFQTLFDRSGIGMAKARMDGQMLFANSVYLEMLGYSANELAELHARDLTHPEDYPIQEELMRQIIDGRRERFQLVKRYLHKDGSIVWGNLVSTSILGTHGQAEFLLGMVEDITTQKRVERELMMARNRAEEMGVLKSSFLRNMSHELRTPLTGIIGFANVLTEDATDEQRELLKLIEYSGNRLLQTLNAILDLSMLESGTMSIQRARINLSDNLYAALHLLEPEAERKGIELIFEGLDDELNVFLDTNCLDRVLQNLIGNAIKFTDEGRVTVSASVEGKTLHLVIADTGIGMDDEFMRYLFEAFRQESVGMARHFEGTGLGLAITKRYAAYLGGSIGVESNEAGGSTFRVTFPDVVLTESFSPPTENASMTDDAAKSAMPKVLVLEDNPDTRLLLRKFLEKDYNVKIASQEEEALQFASDTLFDVVLMDINLGSTRTGVDALKALRHISGYEAIPVVALTAYVVSGDEIRFLSQGFDGYLGKPLSKEDLFGVIERMLKKRSEASP